MAVSIEMASTNRIESCAHSKIGKAVAMYTTAHTAWYSG